MVQDNNLFLVSMEFLIDLVHLRCNLIKSIGHRSVSILSTGMVCYTSPFPFCSLSCILLTQELSTSIHRDLFSYFMDVSIKSNIKLSSQFSAKLAAIYSIRWRSSMECGQESFIIKLDGEWNWSISNDKVDIEANCNKDEHCSNCYGRREIRTTKKVFVLVLVHAYKQNHNACKVGFIKHMLTLPPSHHRVYVSQTQSHLIYYLE